ncbi:MAG: DUF2017 family protein [Planctomycetes bacterium]|nr:DUF2017 family protein [Planctomycetota bacterium]
MLDPRLTIRANGDLQFSQLEEPFMEALREIPRILQLSETDPSARNRLFPNPYDQDEKDKEWMKHCTPDLEHLFRSAGEMFAEDLLSAQRDPLHPTLWRLLLPATHLRAWMSTLNAARLTLGVIHQITEDNMDPSVEPLDPHSGRALAISMIHLLGWIEEMLVHAALE